MQADESRDSTFIILLSPAQKHKKASYKSSMYYTLTLTTDIFKEVEKIATSESISIKQ
jgi:hypothetical protein